MNLLPGRTIDIDTDLVAESNAGSVRIRSDSQADGFTVNLESSGEHAFPRLDRDLANTLAQAVVAATDRPVTIHLEGRPALRLLPAANWLGRLAGLECGVELLSLRRSLTVWRLQR